MFNNQLCIKLQINSTNDIQRVRDYIESLSNQSTSSTVEKITNILDMIFGNFQCRGILSILCQQTFRQQPIQWVKKLELIIDLFGPRSRFVNLLKNNKSLRISIDKSNLPCYLSPNNLQQVNSNLSLRQNYQGVSMLAIQSYFFKLLQKIYQQQCPSINFNNQQSLIKDDFFYCLTRNPYLILLRQNLQYFSNHKQLGNKLLEILKMYLMDGLIKKSKNTFIYKTKFQNKSYRYQLKNSCLLGIYLAINQYRQHLGTHLDLFFKVLSEQFRNVRTSSDTLRYAIRVWLYSVGYTSQIQKMVIQSLKNGNAQTGWFQLRRYHPDQIKKRRLDRRSSYNDKDTIKSWIDLFKQQNNWIPNLFYFYTVTCLFCYIEFLFGKPDKNTNNQQIKKVIKDIIKKLQNSCMTQYIAKQRKKKNFSKILEFYNYLGQSLRISISNVYEIPNILKYVSQNDIERTDLNESYYMDQGNDKDSHKKSLKTYYIEHPKNCWQIPLQFNQSWIFFQISYGIAWILSKIIPGKRHPINIRFLANPTMFIIFLILIYVIVVFII